MKSQGVNPELVEVMLLGSSLTRLERAGSAQRERDYYRRLSKHFDIRIFGYEKGSSEAAFEEMPVLSGNKWIQSLLAPLRLKTAGKGVIRTKQFWGCWSGWIFAKMARRPLIIRCGYVWSRAARHQNPHWPGIVHRTMEAVESILIRLGDGFIFATEEIAEYYGPMVGSKPKSIVPNGFDLEVFKPANGNEVRYDYAYVGRLIPLKGIKDLLAALPSGSNLLVIGDGELSGLVKSNPQVEYLGMVPNYLIPEEICRAKCFVSMSRTEGNPKCLYEAVLCGLYPVLSDIPAHRNLISELGYGTIMGPGSRFPDSKGVRVDKEKLSRFRSDYGFEGVIAREAEFCKAILDSRKP